MSAPVALPALTSRRCGLPECERTAAPGFDFCCNRHWQASLGDVVDPNADGPTSGRKAADWAREQFRSVR